MIQNQVLGSCCFGKRETKTQVIFSVICFHYYMCIFPFCSHFIRNVVSFSMQNNDKAAVLKELFPKCLGSDYDQWLVAKFLVYIIKYNLCFKSMRRFNSGLCIGYGYLSDKYFCHSLHMAPLVVLFVTVLEVCFLCVWQKSWWFKKATKPNCDENECQENKINA